MKQILLKKSFFIFLIFLFSTIGYAQCSILGVVSVNNNNLTYSSFSSCSSVNHTINIGDGVGFSSLKIDKDFDLTNLGPIQLIVNNNANIDFTVQNYDLILAAGSSITFVGTGTLVPFSGSDCSNSDRIKVGNVVVSSCQGAGPLLSFSELVAQGGYSPISATASPSSICNSGNTTLTATASPSSGATYRWYDAQTGGTLLYTGSTYNPFLTATTTYYVDASYGSGGSAYTTIRKAVIVTVSPTTVAGTVSANQSICANSSPSDITLTGSTGTIQWQSSTNNNSGFNDISGATSSTLLRATMGALTSTRYYRAVVKSGSCSSANSGVVTVTVSPATVVGTVSANQSICTGSPPADITLTGSTGTIQWQSSTDDTTFNDISSNGTGSTLYSWAIGALTSTRYYRAVVKSGGCNQLYSNSVKITVYGSIATPSSISGLSAQCAGNTSQIYSVTPVANATSYNWTLPANWTIVSGSGTNSITVNIANNGATGNVSVNAANIGCGTSSSISQWVVVSAPTVVGTVTPANTNVCSPNNSTNLSLNGNTGSILRWESSLDNFAGGTITTINSTGSPITASNVTVDTWYRAVVQNGGCNVQYSNSVKITVYGSVTTPGAISMNGVAYPENGNANYCASSSVVLSIDPVPNATTYAWTTPPGWTLVSGQGTTSATYITGNSSQSENVTVSASNSSICNSPGSRYFYLYLGNTPSPINITTQPSNSAICVGTNTSFSVVASGGTSYQWQVSTDSGANYSNLSNGGVYSNVTTTTMNITAATAGMNNYRYRAVVGGCAGLVTSNAGILTINSTPTTATVGGIQNICAILTTASLGGNTPTVGTGTWTQFSGPGTSTFSGVNSGISTATASVVGTYVYRWTISNGCTSSTADVTVNYYAAPTTATVGGTQNICASLTTASLGGNTPTVGTGIWIQFSGPGTSTFSGVNTGTSTATASVVGTYVYRWTISNGSCTSTADVTVNYYAAPSAPTVGVITHPTCSILTGSVKLSDLPTTGTWTISATPVTSGLTGLTGTGTEATVSGLTANTTYTFTVTVVGGCTSTPSSNVVINANPSTLVTWNGSNWSSAPTPTTRVEFTGGIYNSATNLHPNVDACACYVKNNAVVIFNSGNTLNVINEVKVESGSLTFKNNASLVQENEDPNINSGNIIYERETGILNRYDFTYWSSPVAGMTLGLPLVGLSPTTFFDKYFSYNNAWVLETRATVMKKGAGYSVRAPQSYKTTGSTDIYKAIFTGVPHNGLVTLTSLAGSQAHLLGNPYPSAIDADVFLEKNKDVLEGTLYFWTHNSPPSSDILGDKKYNYTTNDYALYNRTGGTRTAIVDSKFNYPSGTNFKPVTGNIAAGQGFFAPTKAAGGNVVFNNTMRISGGTLGTDNAQFFKLSTSSKATAAKTEKSRIWLNLTNNEGAFKQTLIGYITGATNDYDGGFDGTTYDGNQYVDFYSVNQSVNLAIQGRALPFVKKDSVALGYKSTIKGDFQISIDNTDGVLATQNVFLEDKDLKVLHDLKKEGYTFSTEKGIFNDRFVLRYVDKNAVEEVPEIPQDLNKEVLVSVQNAIITINSPLELLDKVVVYDSAGRKLFQKNKVDVNVFFIQHLISSHQVLVVDILLSNGKKLSRKIVY